MTFIIVTKNAAGETVGLRSTVWAFSIDRATRYATRELAQAALVKAKKFMKAKTYKSSVIIEIPDAQ